MISAEQAYKLVAFGVAKLDTLNNIVDESEELKALNDRQLAVVVICYAASLASLTKLNLHDFLGLAGAAYQNVEISPKHAVYADAARTDTPPTSAGSSAPGPTPDVQAEPQAATAVELGRDNG